MVQFLINATTGLSRLAQVRQSLHLLRYLTLSRACRHVHLSQLIELPHEDLVLSLLDLQFQLQLIVLVDDLRNVNIELIHLLVLHF